MTLDDILERIESYRIYERGWDTYDAAPFTPEHVDHAVRVARLLGDYADIMRVAPYSGGVQLELHHDGRFAEFDVVADGRVYVLSGTEGPDVLAFHQGDDEDIPSTDEDLLRLAAWVRTGEGDPWPPHGGDPDRADARGGG